MLDTWKEQVGRSGIFSAQLLRVMMVAYFSVVD
jgi:hypothetical protein